MNRRQLQAASEQARQRAVALGEAGDTAAVPELIALCRHTGPTVRRAAASALGKLATDATARAAVPSLCELARDAHPQVRQYAMLALGKIGDEAALPALRDAANSSAPQPDYVLAAALKAFEQIEAATRAQHECAPIACSRCRRETCTVVQSRGERQIADWLAAHSIAYRYDDKFQIIQGFAIRPDFYLPRHDVYIEYWGMDTTDYKIGMLLKQKLYQQEDKKLISLYPADLPTLDAKLKEALNADATNPASRVRQGQDQIH
jgi:hypothetical protein